MGETWRSLAGSYGFDDAKVLFPLLVETVVRLVHVDEIAYLPPAITEERICALQVKNLTGYTTTLYYYCIIRCSIHKAIHCIMTVLFSVANYCILLIYTFAYSSMNIFIFLDTFLTPS